MLTKKHLFAMSEDDYMNEDQLAFFKALLTEQKDELDASILVAKESLAHSEHNTDPNDVATQQEMQQIYLRTVERQGRLLNKINESLRDIESGEYGYCEVRGEPIGVRRLFARPTATLSIQAKEAQEHKEKTEGIF
jgi:DnaK suppressor protein